MLKKTIKYILILAIVLTSVFLINGLYYNLKNVKADSDDNTSGYAWSENIGWISFNNTTGGGSNYGVNIDSNTGDLSGYAWSENIGWISFNRSETGNPPENPFQSGTPIAKYDKNSNEITGWMRVLASGGGWDGWIKFYNTTIDNNGDWHGWAWSDIVVGWVSFNGADPSTSGNYKVSSIGVVNQSPIASNLSIIKGNYCTNPSHFFSWTYSDFDGDSESKYEFQVDNNSDFSSLVVNRTINNPTTNNQIVLVSVSPAADKIVYNTTYYWRVNVYDSNGAESGWVTGSSFTTEKHQYPLVNFDWLPSNPSQGEDVLFTDQSTVYGGSSKSAWSWIFTDGNPASSSQQNPTTQFNFTEDKQVTLQVTDSDNYSCSISKTVNVQSELPGWQEN